MPRRDSGLPFDTRNTTDTSGNVLKAYLFEKDEPLHSSTIERIWHHRLADSDLILEEIQRGWRVN